MKLAIITFLFLGCSWWVCGKPVSEEPHSHDATAPADYDDYEPDDDSIAIDDDLEENNILNQEKNADFQRLVARVAQMKTESEKLSDQAKPHNLESNVDNINKDFAKLFNQEPRVLLNVQKSRFIVPDVANKDEFVARMNKPN